MKRLRLTKTSLSFLESLPAKQFRQVVASIFSLLTTPQPHDSTQLKGYPFRRVDIGEYRVIYEISGDDILIQLVGKRNDSDVYKKLGRSI